MPSKAATSSARVWSSFLGPHVLVEDTVTGLDSLCFSQRVSLDVEAVCVVDEAVEDGVGQGWIPDGLVPELDRHLGSDHRRPHIVAIVEDFEQVATMDVLQRRDEPIVKDDEIDVRERGELVPVRAVGSCDVEVVKESRSSEVSGCRRSSKSAPLPKGNDPRKMHHLTTDEAFASSLRCMVWKDMS